MTRWTEEEDDIIRKRRADRITVPVIAAELGRPVPATYARARKLDTRVMERKEWTGPEVRRLETLYKEGRTIEEIALALGRAVNSVRWKLDDGNIALDRVRVWTDAEDALLVEMASGKTARQLDLRTVEKALAERLESQRTGTAIEGRIRALGLFQTSRTTWTDEDVEALKNSLNDLAGFAARSGKDAAAIERKVRALGLAQPALAPVDVDPQVVAAAAARKGGLVELAARLGMPVRSLRAYGQKVGVIAKREPRIMTEEKRERILKAVADGLTVTQAMKALGHDVRVLNKVAEDAGVTFAKAKRKPAVRVAGSVADKPVRREARPRRPAQVRSRAPSARDTAPAPTRSVRPDVAAAAARFAAWRKMKSGGEARV